MCIESCLRHSSALLKRSCKYISVLFLSCWRNGHVLLLGNACRHGQAHAWMGHTAREACPRAPICNHAPPPNHHGTVYRQVSIQSSVRNLTHLLVVSSLKEKASQVKTASVNSYGTAREKFSTQTSSTTTGKAKPPPPPPSRKVSSSSSSNQRSSFIGRAQASPAPSGRTTDDGDNIDWANLSTEDKQAFFAWLDEFFARYLDGSLPSSAAPAVPIFTNSPSNNTPAPSPSPRPSPSLPHRRVSSSTSQNTGPDLQDEVAPVQAAPAASRRNLPPLLSQQGPVCPALLCQLSNIAEVVSHSQRSSILQNHLRPQKYQKRLYQMHTLHIPQARIRVRFLLPPFFLSSLI
jgi:hypothetical protein